MTIKKPQYTLPDNDYLYTLGHSTSVTYDNLKLNTSMEKDKAAPYNERTMAVDRDNNKRVLAACAVCVEKGEHVAALQILKVVSDDKKKYGDKSTLVLSLYQINNILESVGISRILPQAYYTAYDSTINSWFNQSFSDTNY